MSWGLINALKTPDFVLDIHSENSLQVLDTVDEGDAHDAHELGVDDDDDEVVVGEKGEEPRNLFGSARDAVLSIVKKVCKIWSYSLLDNKPNNIEIQQHSLSQKYESSSF